MAKEPNINIFSKTEQEQYRDVDITDLETGRTIPQGVGLKEGTINALQALADQYDISRNALMKFAIRRFLLDLRAGKINLSEYIEIPPKPKRKLKMPE